MFHYKLHLHRYLHLHFTFYLHLHIYIYTPIEQFDVIYNKIKQKQKLFTPRINTMYSVTEKWNNEKQMTNRIFQTLFYLKKLVHTNKINYRLTWFLSGSNATSSFSCRKEELLFVLWHCDFVSPIPQVSDKYTIPANYSSRNETQHQNKLFSRSLFLCILSICFPPIQYYWLTCSQYIFLECVTMLKER